MTLTGAVAFLKDQAIPFEAVEYDHHEKGALFASQAIGVPLAQTIKTLMVEFTPKAHLVVLMPGNKRVPFKKLARLRGAKRAFMADTRTAERLSGYLIGGISPFQMRVPVAQVIDAEVLAFDRVAINGGKRGLMLIMKPSDIVRATGAEPMDLS
jgi:Cys-tRNA(Pro)/Cys-tRNA(Cys) deacylase